MSEVRLQVKNLCKSFGITKAVQNVSFNVNKGEVHALIGENGSGKSTLTNMLTGIYSIGSGTFILDGKEIHPKNQVEANNEGVSIIVQELGTLSGLTVAENIFLGHEEQFVHFGIKNTKAMNRKATELLKKYGFDRIKASDIIDNYNFEDRKLVEIVKATYFDPKIVVVDETTTALSQEGRDELYKHMDRIRNSGNSVIFISHDLPEVLEKSDTITILRDGIYIDTVKSADVTEDDLKRLMVGREVTGDYYRADYGEKVAEAVASGEYDRGILICGTGIGMSIVANKVPGIRCAHCHDSFSARATRMHNDANVIAFGERCIGAGVMLDIVEAFLTTEFEGGRHLARIAKIAEVEKKYSK